MDFCYVDESGTPQIPGNTTHYVLAGISIPDIHLTHTERKNLILDVAKYVSQWGFTRVFAECIDKIHFDPARAPHPLDEQAFEQVVSRFEQYLDAIGSNAEHRNVGVIIHDNNQTVSKRHTELMRRFHRKGTLWTKVKSIIETPLFVDSELTSMVQIADLCAYSLRRYHENAEEELFDLIFTRADRRGDNIVGMRHFSDKACQCKICVAH